MLVKLDNGKTMVDNARSCEVCTAAMGHFIGENDSLSCHYNSVVRAFIWHDKKTMVVPGFVMFEDDQNKCPNVTANRK